MLLLILIVLSTVYSMHRPDKRGPRALVQRKPRQYQNALQRPHPVLNRVNRPQMQAKPRQNPNAAFNRVKLQRSTVAPRLKAVDLYPTAKQGVSLTHCHFGGSTSCPKENLLICVDKSYAFRIHLPDGFYCKQVGKDVVLIG